MMETYRWPCGCVIWVKQSNLSRSAGRSHVSAWPCPEHSAVPQSVHDWVWLQSGARDEAEVAHYLGLDLGEAEVMEMSK